ncbi:MAG: dTDP-4-dehydrorhamnose 3,5-epimerase [Parvibaculaceae bacterium]|jgi:dTDP-4-dehydrorhamnose 3,5-epimerase
MGPAFTPGHDAGFLWNDPTIGIQWPAQPEVISQRDRELEGYKPHD